ncbi:hypothetical protein [Cellulomonas soli]|uniref:Uncharacterized protein n=1 Tax=Cellulomonas soli TaxID=931535 RepID=A0A512PEF8_9CELL|nr:hypothetical protein [Cellulomonas soli]NYI58939.1 hypothetical protein [Cellulomonas soli]GEP69568.1 hypothetical protein CSO01_22830 [Cellulomonas soli]
MERSDGMGQVLQSMAVLPLVAAVVSLRNHSGWNFEIDARPATVRGLRVRGMLVLSGVLMLALGRLLAPGSDPVRLGLALVAVAGAVPFLVYRPSAAPGDPDAAPQRAHQVSRPRFQRRSAVVWLLLFASSVVLAVIA